MRFFLFWLACYRDPSNNQSILILFFGSHLALVHYCKIKNWMILLQVGHNGQSNWSGSHFCVSSITYTIVSYDPMKLIFSSPESAQKTEQGQ